MDFSLIIPILIFISMFFYGYYFLKEIKNSLKDIIERLLQSK